MPLYEKELNPIQGVEQFQFHTPPATSFLRLNKPEKFGDDMVSFRKTVVKASETQDVVFGIEVGRGGPGFRYVFPLFNDNQFIGTCEFGGDLEKLLLDVIKNRFNVEYALGINQEVLSGIDLFRESSNEAIVNNVVFYKFSDPSLKATMNPRFLDSTWTSESIQDRDYFIVSIPLNDFNGSKIGYMTFFMDKTAAIAELNDSIIQNTIIIIIILLLLLAIAIILLRKKLLTPLNKTMAFAEKFGNGDFSSRSEPTSTIELKQLNNVMDTLAEKLSAQVRIISDYSGELKSHSGNIASISRDLSEGMSELGSQSDTMTSAAAGLGENIKQIAEAAEQNATNMNAAADLSDDVSQKTANIAAAIEEISATIDNIARNSRGVVEKVDNSETLAEDATDSVKNLLDSAERIKKITDVIRSITEQTELLSINAAIEAASAGDAGRGFGVVAAEIKELAKQSAEATQEISSLIDAVNDNSGNVSNVIKVLAGNTKEIASLIRDITDAVEQQSSATTDVSESVNDIKQNSDAITMRLTEMAKSAETAGISANEANNNMQEISKELVQVNGKVGTFTELSADVKEISVQIDKISENLSDTVKQFKI